MYSHWVLTTEAARLTEREARRGSLGHFPMSRAMGLMLAHALKLQKFGA